MTTAERRQRAIDHKVGQLRIQAAHAETRAIVASGKCPICGAGLRRNTSLTGWWMCEQTGAANFRRHAGKPSCSWQGFTE